jgi:hypothetical protein
MRYVLYACVAVALAASSCAFSGRRAVPIPCNDAHLAFLPFGGPAPGCEITGKVRIELPRYRFRGLCRILHDSSGKLRIDFEHSSLFGAIRERVTLISGDSLTIYDHGSGTIIAGDSALAVAAGGLGAPIRPDDVLYALLLAAPRCSEMTAPTLERRVGGITLRGAWRGRDVELRCAEEAGACLFKQCFASAGRCFILKYEGRLAAGGSYYPQRIRLFREDGPERISMEVVAVKVLEPNPMEFLIGAGCGRPAAATLCKYRGTVEP